MRLLCGRTRDASSYGTRLVEVVHVTLYLSVWLVDVQVGQNGLCEGTARRVCDQTVHAVRQKRVGSAQGVREMPPLVSFVALRVELDVASRWADNVLVCRHLCAGRDVCDSAHTCHAEVSRGDITGFSNFTGGLCGSLHTYYVLNIKKALKGESIHACVPTRVST